jgi:hypothetical protein
MTTRFAAGVVAGSLALGILIGAAGTIVVRDATAARIDPMAAMADGMDGMSSMMQILDGAMMGGSMMDPDSMGPGSMPGADRSPGPLMSPGSEHDLHHLAATPEPTR